ncbi:MAG: cytochrome c maturation protein CcmE [Alphaproteobacteria bacterium]|nr:cytochrome c maturation protein CcmE [Alphaproteobacteria bacterium]MBV8409739.1 cytochrome c maturation protein CcmE [Alphaproteobacteria bacterium]
MIPKRKRLWLLLGSLAVLGVAVALVLSALNDNLVFFYSPSQVAEKHVAPERRFRLGGLVEAGSVKKNGQEVRFIVTDTHQSVPVVYRGLLPDLFREGQGVVAEGALGPDGVFVAREVLAKHDENYMPPEVAKAIKEAGQWREKR